MNNDDRLINYKEAFELFGLSHVTLEFWRYHKKNPLPYTKEKYLIKYKISDLKKRMEIEKDKPKIKYNRAAFPKEKSMHVYKRDESNLKGVVYENFVPKRKRM